MAQEESVGLGATVPHRTRDAPDGQAWQVVGVGIDIVEVARMTRAVERRGDRFLRRFFTPRELEACLGSRHQYERLAARFAAKEATLKALGTGLRRVRWTEVEVRSDPLGKPVIQLAGAVAGLAVRQGVATVHLSLSHGREHAVAHALAVGPGPGPESPEGAAP